MNNQTLAILAWTPLGMAFLLGMFGIESPETDTLIGLCMAVFITWACLRLYRTPDKAVVA